MGKPALLVDVAAEARELAQQVAEVEQEITQLASRGAMFGRQGAYSMYCNRELRVSAKRHPSQDLARCPEQDVVVNCPEHPEVEGAYTHIGSWNGRPLFGHRSLRLYWGTSGNWRICTFPEDVQDNLAVVISMPGRGADHGELPADVARWVWWTGLQWAPSRARVRASSGSSEATPPPSPWVHVDPEAVHEDTPRHCGIQRPTKSPTPCFGQMGRA